jgi:hypothetical protein
MCTATSASYWQGECLTVAAVLWLLADANVQRHVRNLQEEPSAYHCACLPCCAGFAQAGQLSTFYAHGLCVFYADGLCVFISVSCILSCFVGVLC